MAFPKKIYCVFLIRRIFTLLKKIVVIGPESTGKSTLSAALAAALDTVWVAEYAREYLNNLERDYIQNDLLAIAHGQIQIEDIAASKAEKTLICDTDLNIIKVWAEEKYGFCDTWVLQTIAIRKYDLYLLCDIDIPWEYDPLREHSATEKRQYFYSQYKDIVINSNVPWMSISGSMEERLQQALNAVDKFLKNK